jgi:small subunit ribosomal protein S20
MLRHKSAQKRARQTKKITERNKQYKALLKSAIKKVTSTKEKDSLGKEFQKTTKLIDRAATKGIIHKNKAANTKSKLAKLVRKAT